MAMAIYFLAIINKKSHSNFFIRKENYEKNKQPAFNWIRSVMWLFGQQGWGVVYEEPALWNVPAKHDTIFFSQYVYMHVTCKSIISWLDTIND